MIHLFRTASLLLLTLMGPATMAQNTIPIDPGKSKITWHASKVTGAHEGHVSVRSGSIVVKEGGLQGVEVDMDMGTITCTDISSEASNARLVDHLKSEDFFAVEDHPTATFRSTSVEISDQEGSVSYYITGDLTIKDITHPITFNARQLANEDRYLGTLTFDRTKYDIKYRSGAFFPEIGDRMIYDEVQLDLDIRTR